jgi:hypothetical protein
MNFFLKELEAYSIDERMKSILRFIPRADEELFIEFCEDFDYAVLFEAFKL